MWNLKSDTDGKRKYVNSLTASECTISKLYTDKEGNAWYGFDNLMVMPYTRQFQATKISALYQLGLSKDDLNGHIARSKTIAKSNDSEKYEKIYAEFLDFESKVSSATDAVKQMSSLVCVYYLLNDEKIDAFDNSLQIQKMSLLEADLDAHSFFLSRLITDMENYIPFSKMLFQTASQ